MRVLLVIFIGLLLTGFIGMGVQAFYPAPVAPEPEFNYYNQQQSQTAADKQKVKEYEAKTKVYEKACRKYYKFVSMFLIPVAAVILVLCLTALRNLPVIANGFMLGGIFTLMQSLGWCYESEDTSFLFILVGSCLVVSLVFTYLRYPKEKPLPS